MHRSREGSKGVECVGENVIILLVVLRLMLHKLFRGSPMAVC